MRLALLIISPINRKTLDAKCDKLAVLNYRQAADT